MVWLFCRQLLNSAISYGPGQAHFSFISIEHSAWRQMVQIVQIVETAKVVHHRGQKSEIRDQLYP